MNLVSSSESNPERDNTPLIELQINDEIAHMNRMRFRAHQVLALNLISANQDALSHLLRITLRLLPRSTPGIVLQSAHRPESAPRIETAAPEHLILHATNADHLTASLITQALNQINLDDFAFVFIHNHEDPAAPTEYDLGEELKIFHLDLSQAIYPPSQYARIYEQANVILLDTLTAADEARQAIETFRREAAIIQPKIQILEIASHKQNGAISWIEFLQNCSRAAEDLFDPYSPD
ncbi:MAG: hypothetical protein JW750_10025 [Anaerolineaceae bacterium]|nr:hypothetical protein [Anaerolineaceae bacterium]